MSTVPYVEVFRTTAQPRPLPLQSLAMPLVRQSVERPVTLTLDSVMFTGRVPLSTWTFTIAVANKLWVSDRTTLYFGKETRINRDIYRDRALLQGHRVSLDVSVAVYNNYGDVLQAKRPVRFYESGSLLQPSALLTVEHNWMQLMFKFRLRVHETESV